MVSTSSFELPERFDNNLFDNNRMDRGDVQSAGWIASGRSVMRQPAHIRERLANMPDSERNTWTSRSQVVRDKVKELSDELKTIDPMTEKGSYRSRLASLNKDLEIQKGELVNDLDGDLNLALEILDSLTERDLLASSR
jgi:hypothetical protein